MDLAPKLTMLISLLIFGTIGLVRRFIPLDSVPLALLRALLGCVTLVLIMAVTRQPCGVGAFGYKGKSVLLCGLLLGLDWICFLSPLTILRLPWLPVLLYGPGLYAVGGALVFHETLGPWKLACAGCTILGMLLVSGYVAVRKSRFKARGWSLPCWEPVLCRGYHPEQGHPGPHRLRKSATSWGLRPFCCCLTRRQWQAALCRGGDNGSPFDSGFGGGPYRTGLRSVLRLPDPGIRPGYGPAQLCRPHYRSAAVRLCAPGTHVGLAGCRGMPGSGRHDWQ